jgi:peptidoglycan/LPS O-acetylase OafA/YrhL
MRYNPALDGIRAIAITLVLARHARVPELSGGFLGVDVFFVLSGYLITSILLTEIRGTGTISLGSFYLRRLQRLYPPMLAVLLAYVVVGPYLWPGLETPLLHAGVAAIYMSDYAHILSVGVGKIGYLWSLAVEEKFYLLWPLGLLFIVKQKRPIKWMLGLVFVSTAWRFLEWSNGHSWARLYFSFDTHASGLMIGSALAIILARHQVRSNWVVGVAAFAVILAAANTFRWKTNSSILYGTLVAELATVALILSAQSARGWLASAPLVFVGKYSYGLYLWHMPIMVWLRAQYDWPITLLVGSVLGMLASIVSYHTIEAYFRKRKKPRMHALAAEQAAR